MTLKDEIRHLHRLLKHKDRWYIETQCPDIDIVMDVAEKAKEGANDSLQNISLGALYNRYVKWAKEDKIIPLEGDYYRIFLNDVVWDMGLASLKGSEKSVYTDSVSLTIEFI